MQVAGIIFRQFAAMAMLTAQCIFGLPRPVVDMMNEVMRREGGQCAKDRTFVERGNLGLQIRERQSALCLAKHPEQ